MANKRYANKRHPLKIRDAKSNPAYTQKKEIYLHPTKGWRLHTPH